MKYDTLLTRPCKTPKRILEQKKFVHDFLLFTSDVEKIIPLMEAREYGMKDLVEAKNFFAVYQSSMKISKEVPQYGFVDQLYEGNFFKLETLLHYLRLNFVFDIGDNEVLLNFGQLNEMLQIKFDR